MALIICPECGGKVSDKAPACVHCGYPIGSADIKNSKVEEVEVVQERHENIEGFNSLPIFEKKENGIYEVNETNLDKTLETLSNIAKEKGIEVSLREKGSEEMLKLLETIPDINEMDKLAIHYQFWRKKSSSFALQLAKDERNKCLLKVHIDRKTIPLEEIITWRTPLLNLSYIKDTDRWVAFGFGDIPCMEKYEGVERLNLGKPSNEWYDCDPYIVHENAKNNRYTDKELEYCDILEKMIDSVYECARKAPSNYIFPCFNNETSKQKRTAELQKNISDREKVKQDMKSKAAGRNAYNEFIAMHKDNSPKPKCFSCGSTNLKKITFANKAGSAYLFGIFAAGKASKSWHCNDCGTEW